MEFETLTYEKLDRVARVTMNRPQFRNAQNMQMSRDLIAAIEEAVADRDVRVVILAGAGPHFSAGHDLGSPEYLAELKEHPRGPGAEIRLEWEEEVYLNPCLKWREAPKPTIAQVHGKCIMGGYMLAAACDLIMASEDAEFADMGARMGGGGVEYLAHPWDLGIRKAKEMLFTGDAVSAQEAWRLGMVNRVVKREELAEATLALANRIAQNPSFGLRMAKTSINQMQDAMGFRQAIAYHMIWHQLAHSHREEIGGPSYPKPGENVAEWAKKRDERFGKEGTGA